jgi:hypothetical protein
MKNLFPLVIVNENMHPYAQNLLLKFQREGVEKIKLRIAPFFTAKIKRGIVFVVVRQAQI